MARKAKKKAAATRTSAGARPVPPDAVRVWRGFRLGTLMPADFLQALGTIFIPVTAQLQRLYGLTTYMPSVLPQDKPIGVPDEIALVFYETQQAYTDTSKIVAGRAYSSLHKTCFAFPASLSGFPVLFASAPALDQPYHLFKKAVDWREGYAQVFVGARPAATDAKRFASQLGRFFQTLQRRPASSLDGAIFCISAAYVVYWEHWQSKAASEKGSISDLAKLAQQVVLQAYTPLPINPDLKAHDPGFSRNQIDSKSLNIVFPR